MNLKRWLMKRLGRAALPYLKAHGLVKANKHNPALLWHPGRQRILVLAPHMDDEVIGCGGTLCQHLRQGAQVTVVYLTDGRYGGTLDGSTVASGEANQVEALVDIRQREARQALAVLGIEHSLFWGIEEGNLASTPDILGQLRQLVEEVRPQIVYLPFFLEEHPEHRITSQIMLDATEGASFGFDCYGYEVWTPLFPNCLVDITDVVELKRRSLQQYRSQLAVNDYVHAALGLNAYRAMALSQAQAGYVEAFFQCSLMEYRTLYQDYAAP